MYLRRIVVLFLTLLLLLASVLGITARILQQQLLDSAKWKSRLAAQQIYELPHELAADALLAQQEERLPESLEHLRFRRSEIVDLLEQGFPPVWLKQNVEELIDATEAWWNEETETIAFALDIRPQKAFLREGLIEFLDEKQASWPVCTEEEMIALTEDREEITSVSCLPPGVDLSRLVFGAQGESLAADLVTLIPDEIDLPALMAGELIDTDRLSEGIDIGEDVRESERARQANYETMLQQLEYARAQARLLETMYQMLWVVIGGLVSLIVVLTWRQLTSLLRWLGVTLIVLGFHFGGLGIAMPVLQREVQTLIMQATVQENWPDALIRVVIALPAELFAELSRAFYQQAGMLTMMGVGLLVWRWILLRNEQQPDKKIIPDTVRPTSFARPKQEQKKTLPPQETKTAAGSKSNKPKP